MAYQPPPAQQKNPAPIRTLSRNPTEETPRREPDPVPVGAHPGQAGWLDAGPPNSATRENMRRQGGLPKEMEKDEPGRLGPAPGYVGCPRASEGCTWAGKSRDLEKHFKNANAAGSIYCKS